MLPSIITKYFDTFKNAINLGFYSFFSQILNFFSIFFIINFYENKIVEVYFLTITSSALLTGIFFFGLDKITIYERDNSLNSRRIYFLIFISLLIFFILLILGSINNLFFIIAIYNLYFSFIYILEILYTIQNKIRNIGLIKFIPNLFFLIFFATFHNINPILNLFFLMLFLIISIFNIVIFLLIFFNLKINISTITNFLNPFANLKFKKIFIIWSGDYVNIINFYVPSFMLLYFFSAKDMVIYNLILQFGFAPINFITYNLAKSIDLYSIQLKNNKEKFISTITRFFNFSIFNAFVYVFSLFIIFYFFDHLIINNYLEASKYIILLIPLFFSALISVPISNLLFINSNFKNNLILHLLILSATLISIFLSIFKNNINLYYISLSITVTLINFFIIFFIYKKYLKSDV